MHRYYTLLVSTYLSFVFLARQNYKALQNFFWGAGSSREHRTWISSFLTEISSRSSRGFVGGDCNYFALMTLIGSVQDLARNSGWCES